MSRLEAVLGRDALQRDVYLTTDEAAQLLSKPTRDAFIKWARRHGIPLRRAAGCTRGPLVVRKGDLDWALRVPDPHV